MEWKFECLHFFSFIFASCRLCRLSAECPWWRRHRAPRPNFSPDLMASCNNRLYPQDQSPGADEWVCSFLFLETLSIFYRYAFLLGPHSAGSSKLYNDLSSPVGPNHFDDHADDDSCPSWSNQRSDLPDLDLPAVDGNTQRQALAKSASQTDI